MLPHHWITLAKLQQQKQNPDCWYFWKAVDAAFPHFILNCSLLLSLMPKSSVYIICIYACFFGFHYAKKENNKIMLESATCEKKNAVFGACDTLFGLFYLLFTCTWNFLANFTVGFFVSNCFNGRAIHLLVSFLCRVSTMRQFQLLLRLPFRIFLLSASSCR